MELKVIAYGCMILDHFAAVFLPPGQAYYICRSFGRLAFPLFVYGIVKGIRSTSSIKRYVLRILSLALVSQIPFMVLFGVRRLNVCFELCGILLVLLLLKSWRLRYFLPAAAGLVLCCYSEYDLKGLLLGISMYILWNQCQVKYPVWALFAAGLNRGFYRVSALAALLIRRYERFGSKRKAPKYFYLIYPGHLVLFILVKHFFA